MNRHFQRGFSLIELMVAMVIGLIVLLGAGQLYVTLRQNQQRAEQIAARQDTVLYAASTLLRDIRTAKDISIDDDDGALTLSITVDGSRGEDYCPGGSGRDDDVGLTYFIEDDKPSGKKNLMVETSCRHGSVSGALVSGLRGFDVAPLSNGMEYRVTLTLDTLVGASDDSHGDVEELVFRATNRNQVLKRRNGENS